MMDYASIIKERVSTPDLFAFYGFEPNRTGFVRCMFHPDEHASMKVYDGERGYHCFSCKASGDIIDFVRKYFGLPFRDALAKINNDLHLGLPIAGQASEKQRAQLRRETEDRRVKREAFQKKRDELVEAYGDALAEWIRLDLRRLECAPTDPSEPFHEPFVEALQKIDQAAYDLSVAEGELFEFENQKNN